MVHFKYNNFNPKQFGSYILHQHLGKYEINEKWIWKTKQIASLYIDKQYNISISRGS